MIRSQEIKEKAREYSVPADIILKGGTGIKKAYHENYRFSDDLDFSLTHSFKDKELFDHMNEAVNKAKEEVGISFQINSKFPKTETGFRGKIYFNMIQNATGTPLSIKVDITNYDNEIILLPTEKKKIFHSYSDELNAEIKVYSLEEIFTEKLRALIQRTRARDLYDTEMLYDLINKDKVLQILDEKFNFKRVILDVSSLIKRKDDFSNAWDASLNHQLKAIPDFEISFNKAITIINEITA